MPDTSMPSQAAAREIEGDYHLPDSPGGHCSLKFVQQVQGATLARAPAREKAPVDQDLLRRIALNRADRGIEAIATEDSRRFEQILTSTVAGLRADLRKHLPPGSLRDFYLWGIAPECEDRNQFLQITGITQLVKMTVTLLDGLLDDREWEQLAPYCARMNSYQMLEIVSDNLAIGLARPVQHDAATADRRILLRAFNHAMVERLHGEGRSAVARGNLESGARRISLFAQSLAPVEQRRLAERFVRRHGGDLADIEHGVAPLLVANIEAGAELADYVRDCNAYELVRHGLVRRYQGVNQLLESQTMSLARRVAIGIDTILVVPTLAYYIAALAERIRPRSALPELIVDGTLAHTLDDAALIVRLLNDLGTTLLMQGSTERAAFLETLHRYYRADPVGQPTIADVLMHVAPHTAALTRLEKDIMFGEFNLGLHGVLDCTVPEAVAILGDHMDWLAHLFTETAARLADNLKLIGARLRDGLISELIGRFVHFHMILYSKPHATHAGEYAVGGLRFPELILPAPDNTERKGHDADGDSREPHTAI